MFNVIIADDESIIRRRLKECVDWENCGFCLIDEASDGQELLNKVITHHPDLVITDIKMPHMTAIDFVSELRKREIFIEVVVISGYSKFEYAKELLKYGVSDYLLKPIDKDELYSVLTKLNTTIRQKKKGFLLSAQNTIIQFLNGTADSIHIDFKENGFSMLSVFFECKTGSISNHIKIFSYYFDMFFDNWLIIEKSQKSIVILLNCEYDLLEKQLYDAFQTVNDEISERDNHDSISVFYCTPSHSFQNIKEQYQKLSNVNSIRAFSGKKCFANADKISLSLNEHMYFDIHENPYINNILKKIDKDDFIIIKKEYDKFSKMMIDANMSFSVIKQNNFILMNILYHNLIENNKQTDKIKNIFKDVFTKYNDLEYYDEVINYVTDLLFAVNHEFSLKPNNTIEKYYREAMNYIQKNFMSTISLSDVADHLGISTGYLSIIFKQKKMGSFVKHLRGLRVQEAKKLLTSSGKKVYEIALELGFYNARYFSELFKSETGLTPLDYRKKYSK